MKALGEAQDIIKNLEEEAYDHPTDVANVLIRLVQDNGIPIEQAKELAKYKFETQHNSEEDGITIEELLERYSNSDLNRKQSERKEAIKASTLSQFEWCPIDAFVEHLKEIGDDRVDSTSKSSAALQDGEALHENTFGLLVNTMEEDTGKEILEKMQAEQVTAINHGDYQIQGAPDEVRVEKNKVRVVDMKTTGWDGKDAYKEHQLPPSEFQMQIYSWMLSHVPGVTVANPEIVVKRRENGSTTEWFTEEIEYDRNETEKKIDYVLSLFENPKKLPDLRPDEDWKCKNDNHWEEFIQGVALSD